jgi:hypothetical protein
MAAVLDQKTAFSERLKRINSGTQYEPGDAIGYHTQMAYNLRFGDRHKRPKRSLLDRLMVLVAFLCGISSVTLGRLAYFHLSQIKGLPEAFYDLQGRGMILFALVTAMVLVVIFHLATRSRLQSLALGCVLMHFGEAAMAATVPQLWSELFSAEYVAAVAAESASLVPASS